jgi:hypothetical protein
VLAIFERRIQVHIVLILREKLDECSQLIRRSRNDEINILCCPRGAIVRTGERSGEHVGNSGLTKRQRDPVENSETLIATVLVPERARRSAE